jgi:hypothetical protein
MSLPTLARILLGAFSAFGYPHKAPMFQKITGILLEKTSLRGSVSNDPSRPFGTQTLENMG